MKAKLPKPQAAVEPGSENEGLIEKDDNSESEIIMPRFEPKTVLRSKQSLFVTFSGVIESGNVTDEQALSVLFIVTAGEDWRIVNGQKSGISQVGSCSSSNHKRIVWNFPFEVTYETTVLSGWPQLILVVSGTDFFGRNVIRAYGNVHLPCSSGKQERTVNLFKPLPQSLLTGFFGYLNGCVAQYKEPEKILGSGEGREVTRVRTVGHIKVKVETVKYNFESFGYS